MHAYTFESRIDVELEISAVVGSSGQIKLAWHPELTWSSENQRLLISVMPGIVVE